MPNPTCACPNFELVIGLLLHLTISKELVDIFKDNEFT